MLFLNKHFESKLFYYTVILSSLEEVLQVWILQQ